MQSLHAKCLLAISVILVCTANSFSSLAFADVRVLDPTKGIPSCPALYSGKRLILKPPFSGAKFVDASEVNHEDPAFLAASRIARNVVSYFEDDRRYIRNGGPPYDSVSGVDDLSIGQLQWNWKGGRGTLVAEFFRKLPPSLVDTPNPELKHHLFSLRRYAMNSNPQNLPDAKAAVEHWRTEIATTASPLRAWLRSSAVARYQDSLIAERHHKAHILAKTWMRDRQYPDQVFEKVVILFINFNVNAGLYPSRGGLRGVWVDQVDSFVSDFNGDRKRIFQYILDWMKSCDTLEMNGRADAFDDNGNVAQWGNAQLIDSLSEEQVDLFVYAFLYATRSNTDYKRGDVTRVKGYSQLDVLNRAGVIVLGAGKARGSKFDWARFRVR